MKLRNRLALPAAVLCLCFAFGCEDSFEDDVDDVTDEIEDTIDDAADDIEDAIDDAGDEIEDATDK